MQSSSEVRKFKLVQIYLSQTRWLDPDLLTDKILDMMLFHSVQSLAERKSRLIIFRGVALSINSEALLVNHQWPWTRGGSSRC